MTDNSIALARTTDPGTSKAAATRASRRLSELRQSVLAMVEELGICIGSQINDEYRSQDRTPHCAWDSPRKRAGELADAGYLEVVGVKDGESEYVCTFKGWQYLNSGDLA